MSDTINQAVAVRLIWQRAGVDHAVNVLHYQVGAGFNADQAAVGLLGDVIGAAFTSSGYAAQVTTTDQLNRVALRDRRTPNAAEFVSVEAVPGTSVSEALPGANALVVTLRTALAGRGFRGRTYLPCWAESANTTGGVITPTAIAAATSFLTSLRNIVIASFTMTLAVAHQFNNKLPLEPGQLNVVTSHLVRDNIWDVQRRRNVPGI